MYTVEFTLTYRNPFFLHLIASLGGSIVKANKPNVPIGTGPFQVVTNNEDKLTLQAFEHYFGTNFPLYSLDEHLSITVL